MLHPNANALFAVARIEESNAVSLKFAYKQNYVLREIANMPSVFDFTADYDDEGAVNPEKEFTFRVNAAWDADKIVAHVEKFLTKFFADKKAKEDKTAAAAKLRADYIASLEALEADAE